MAQMWYVRRGDNVSGPFPAERVRLFALAGQLSPSTEIAKTPNGPWYRADTIKGLFPNGGAPPQAKLTTSLPPPLPVASRKPPGLPPVPASAEQLPHNAAKLWLPAPRLTPGPSATAKIIFTVAGLCLLALGVLLFIVEFLMTPTYEERVAAVLKTSIEQKLPQTIRVVDVGFDQKPEYTRNIRGWSGTGTVTARTNDGRMLTDKLSIWAKAHTTGFSVKWSLGDFAGTGSSWELGLLGFVAVILLIGSMYLLTFALGRR